MLYLILSSLIQSHSFSDILRLNENIYKIAHTDFLRGKKTIKTYIFQTLNLY